MSKIPEYYLGVDIGGTNLKAILLDENKKELKSYNLATPKDNVEHFFIMLKALIDPLIKISIKNKAKIRGIGLGVPGIYNPETRKIIKLPNIPLLNNVDIISRIEKEFELPIKIDNDANCFLTAEVKMNLEKKYKNIFALTLGTDVGSAWWVDNKIYRGKNKSVNEITRMVIENPNNLKVIYQSLVGSNAEELAENAYRGDKNAQETFEKVGHYLGIACANVVNLIDPEIIVMGGNVVKSSDLFFPKIRKIIEKLAMHPEAKNIKIVKAKVKGEVGAKGAALLWDE